MKKILLVIPILLLTACSKGSSTTTSEVVIQNKYTPNDGRLMASTNCFQCHGTNGISKTSWDSIAGEDVDEFYESGHPIMKAQTKAFSNTEVNSMFSYLNSMSEAEENEDKDEENEDD